MNQDIGCNMRLNADKSIFHVFQFLGAFIDFHLLILHLFLFMIFCIGFSLSSYCLITVFVTAYLSMLVSKLLALWTNASLKSTIKRLGQCPNGGMFLRIVNNQKS